MLLAIWIIVVIDVKVVHERQRINKRYDGKVNSVKTKRELSESQRKDKNSDDMKWMMIGQI